MAESCAGRWELCLLLFFPGACCVAQLRGWQNPCSASSSSAQGQLLLKQRLIFLVALFASLPDCKKIVESACAEKKG